MRVSTDSVLSSFECYNGIKYYRYEKAYTARAFGFKDTPFYMTILATIRMEKCTRLNMAEITLTPSILPI